MVMALQEAAETCVPYMLNALLNSQKTFSWQDESMEKEGESKSEDHKTRFFSGPPHPPKGIILEKP